MLNSVLLEGIVVETPEAFSADGKTCTRFYLDAPYRDGESNTFEVRAFGDEAQSKAARLSKGQTCRIVGSARQTANEAWSIADVIEVKRGS
jgi:single-stranded DNA-binding protein